MAKAVLPVPGLPAINTPFPVILPFVAMLTIMAAALRADAWPIIPCPGSGCKLLSSNPNP